MTTNTDGDEKVVVLQLKEVGEGKHVRAKRVDLHAAVKHMHEACSK